MKRSKAIRTILKVLRNWEGSKLEAKTAHEILSALTMLGIVRPPPVTWIPKSTGIPELCCIWEPE